MPDEEPGAEAPATAELWDTQYLPIREAFGAFREGICSAFMPWTIESEPQGGFDGRIESVILDGGSIARVRMTPIGAARTRLDVSHSQGECVYGNFVLAGELLIEQQGRTNVARQGDLILYDSRYPTTLSERHSGQYMDVPFMISKQRFAPSRNLEGAFDNIVLGRESLIRPLANSLSFIGEHMTSLQRQEVSALFDACVALLPVAIGREERARSSSEDIPQASPLLRDILDFVNRNLSRADLSPQVAAANLRVSVRYVHKLFAAKGATFGAYVTSKRLEHVCKDLTSHSCRNQPISVLAYRWGFNDLSTFNRAFKLRYGVSPTQYRASSGT